MQRKKLLIHEVSERSGVPASAIRYYVRQGLLTPQTERKNGGSCYHYYSEEDVRRIMQIRQLQAVGYSLSEIRTQLNEPGFSLAAALEKKIGAVQETIAAEQEKLAFLRTVQLTGVLPEDTGLQDDTAMLPEETASAWNLTNALRARKEALSHITAEYTALGARVNETLSALREAGEPPSCEKAQECMREFYEYICERIVPLTPAVFAAAARIGAGSGLFALWNRKLYGKENTAYFAEAMQIFAEHLREKEDVP